jgi:hypothetical protein
VSQTVDELVDQVRTQLDESNINDVDDPQILQALNRAQRSATNTASRQYESMFWKTTTLTTDGTNELAIPSDAFGRKVEMLEVGSGTSRYQLKRLPNHQTSSYYSSTANTSTPTHYSLTKNTIVVYPTPSSGLSVHVSYTKKPEPMVLSQGRVTSFAAGYVLVDELGDDISTSVTGYGSYINFIDYNTGEIKGSCQVSAIDTTLKQVSIKTTGLTRSTVLGRTVATSLPTDLSVDDYVCLITGTAVPELDEAYVDYLVQYAVVEIKRRFGESIEQELPTLKDLKDELDAMWAGRESSGRVVRTNRHYFMASRRRRF